MRKKVFVIGLLLLASFFLKAYAQTAPDEKLFQDAKILIFDEKWNGAQQKLDELMVKYPESPWFSQALFYKAKCLAEQKGKEREAVSVYKNYLERKDKNANLAEESETSIIALASNLYSGGEKSYLKEIEERLESPNKVVKYYAAFELSYIEDKSVASKGIPVLKQIVDQEKDARFKDRAKIALLRVSPDALKDLEEEKYANQVRVLKIRVIDQRTKKEEVAINIPWALADLALGAIPETDRATMRKKGYDLDKIIKNLTRSKGNIIEISNEGKVIKIWIE
jgi:outer membrane protein assembly factor BamD (BamD/ComL family)